MLSKFHFCPECGKPDLLAEKNKKITCKSCGFSFYFNASAAVGALIFNADGQILCSERGRDPHKGLYDLPGGFVETQETAEDALIREIHEELNLEVVEMEYIASFPNQYTYKDILYFPLDLFYICKVKDLSIIKPQDDVASFVWVKPSEVRKEMIAFESVWKVIQRYLN